jgi:hypothetical protein
MKKTILFLTINIIFLTTNYLLAQTCQAYIPNEWEDNRYTNHGNGTVTDNQTNLMWKTCTQGGKRKKSLPRTHQTNIMIATTKVAIVFLITAILEKQ